MMTLSLLKVKANLKSKSHGYPFAFVLALLLNPYLQQNFFQVCCKFLSFDHHLKIKCFKHVFQKIVQTNE